MALVKEKAAKNGGFMENASVLMKNNKTDYRKNEQRKDNKKIDQLFNDDKSKDAIRE